MKNRNKIISFFAILAFGLIHMSCEKYHGDIYDFSNATPNYIIFAGVADPDYVQLYNADTAAGGNRIESGVVNLQTRVNFQFDVDYTFEYSIDGLSGATSVKGTYPRGVTSSPLSFQVVDDAMFGGKDSITGTVVLKTATGKNGALNVGYPDAESSVKFKFKAYKIGTNARKKP